MRKETKEKVKESVIKEVQDEYYAQCKIEVYNQISAEVRTNKENEIMQKLKVDNEIWKKN